VTLAGVSDKVAVLASRLQKTLDGLNGGAHRRKIVSHPVHITSWGTKIILHVDDEDAGVVLVDVPVVRPRIGMSNLDETRNEGGGRGSGLFRGLEVGLLLRLVFRELELSSGELGA